MADERARAMIDNHVDGKCSADFTVPEAGVAVTQMFPSESQARKWIDAQAVAHDVEDEEIIWVIGRPNV